MGPKKSGEQEEVRRDCSVGASSQANPVRRSQRIGQDQARAARATGAGATDDPPVGRLVALPPPG